MKGERPFEPIVTDELWNQAELGQCPDGDDQLSTAEMIIALTTATLSGNRDKEKVRASIEALRRMCIRRSVLDVLSEADGLAIKLVSFTGCEQLLRGSRLSTLMRGRARIFMSSGGSAETYQMSEEVKRLGAFISHNWSVARIYKFMALALYFNANLAFGVFLVFSVLIGAGNIAGVLPHGNYVEYEPYPGGLCARPLLVPIFVIVLCFWRDFEAMLAPRRGPLVFLDKTCIHQEDQALQHKGIKKLGAFLSHSDDMVIIYSDVYLKKLWTVYEVASFILLKPEENMKIVPVFQAQMFFAGIAVIYARQLVALTLGTLFVDYYDLLIPVFTLNDVLVGLVLRSAERSKLKIKDRLANFTVRDCTCAVEADRAVVYGSIAALVKAVKLVPMEASDEMALDAFDALVRERLPAVFGLLMRRLLTYKQVMMLLVLSELPKVVEKIAAVAYDRPPREVFGAAFYTVVYVSTCPLWLEGLARLASLWLHLKGWREVAFVCAWPACIVAAKSPLFLRFDLMFLTFTSDIIYVVLPAIAIFVGTCGFLAWTARCPCDRRRRDLV